MGIGQVSMKLAKMGTGALLSVGAAVGAAVAHFTTAGSALADMSARTGLAASTLAELQFAADMTGASIGDVETAIKRSQKEGKDFFKIADAIAAVEDPAERTRMALDAWGKSGTKLLPMVNNLKALREEARAKGLVPTDEAVASADLIGDKFDTVWKQIKQGIFELGALVGPMLVPIVDVISDVLSATLKWAQSNDLIISSIRAVGHALIGGDWALAAQIVAKEWQIVFQNVLVIISTMINGILGDAIAKLYTDVIKGDLAGAWDTVTKGMAAAWDALVAGMVGAFKTATSNIRALIQTITNQISSTAYKLADFVDSTGATGVGAAIRQAGAGASVIGTGADAKLETVESVAAAMEQQAMQRAIESMGDAMEHISGGGEEAVTALVKLQQELLELQKRAKEARDKGLAGVIKKDGDAFSDDDGAKKIPKFSIAPTFSASALARMGGQKTADKAEKQRDRLIKIEEDILREFRAKEMLFVA